MRHLIPLLLVCVALPAAEGCCPDPASAPGTACAMPAEPAAVALADLKRLITEQKVVLLDANGSESFAKGRLPGAIDFTANAAKLAEVLPADKGTLIVAYCGGPKCGAWKAAAKAASALGYTNIKHFPGGLAGWKEAGGQLVAAK